MLSTFHDFSKRLKNWHKIKESLVAIGLLFKKLIFHLITGTWSVTIKYFIKRGAPKTNLVRKNMNEISLPWGSLSFKTEILKKKSWFTIFVHPGDGKKKNINQSFCVNVNFFARKKNKTKKHYTMWFRWGIIPILCVDSVSKGSTDVEKSILQNFNFF